MTRTRMTAAAFAAAALFVPLSASAHAPGFVFAAFGTATVDGAFSPGEWQTAAALSFAAAAPGGGSVPGELRVMNDDSNLYIGVRLGTTATAGVAIGFDNDHDGVRFEDGSDGLALMALAEGFVDTVLSARGGCPPSAVCGFDDDELGGTIDGSGARTVGASETIIELSHPLDSTDDLNDFSLRPGDVVGFGLQVSLEGVLTVVVPFDPLGDIRVIEPIPPDTQLTDGPGEGSFSGASATFAFTGSDNADSPAQLTFACKLDDTAFTSCTNPVTFSGLADGTHHLSVSASDRSGNVDPVPATRTWTVDATAPDTMIGRGPKKLTRARAATFSFSGQDALTAEGELVFVCSLDGGAATACTSPSTLSGVADGRHTFSAVAVDRAGNRDASPAEFAWTVDATPPAKPRVRGPHTTGTRRPTYRFSSHDALTARRALTFLCALDRGVLRRCSPVLRPTLRPGRHLLRVAAVDRAGNRSAITRFSVAVKRR